MQSVSSWRRRQAAVAALALLLAAPSAPVAAQDLFARHTVSVQIATHDGKPMADAEVRVFAPGKTGQPTLTGRTDSAGKFEFPASEDGFWSVEARAGDEIARVMVRVGDERREPERLSPFWLIGGLFLLLAVAFGYRIARARARRPRA
jgi:uncharacterized protein DUF4198